MRIQRPAVVRHGTRRTAAGTCDSGHIAKLYQVRRPRGLHLMWNGVFNVLTLCLLAGVPFIAVTCDASKTSADPLASEAHLSTCSTCRLPDYGKVGGASVYGPEVRIHAHEPDVDRP
jgi:hypothetical protein